jgi:hypothetical protein
MDGQSTSDAASLSGEHAAAPAAARTRRRQLSAFGPLQFCDELGLPQWAFWRAIEDGLIAHHDRSDRKWSAGAVDDALGRLEKIRASVGTVPDIGAETAAALLSERFGLDLHPNVLLELARVDAVPVVGDHKGYPVYCGRTLEAFDDRARLQRAVHDGQLLQITEVAEYLQIRVADAKHLVRAGRLVEVLRVRSSWQRSRRAAPIVPLYRTGDLDALLTDPTIDWQEVRSTPLGRPSSLAKLATHTATQQ